MKLHVIQPLRIPSNVFETSDRVDLQLGGKVDDKGCWVYSVSIKASRSIGRLKIEFAPNRSREALSHAVNWVTKNCQAAGLAYEVTSQTSQTVWAQATIRITRPAPKRH